ncbi:KTSC domain-containing protein [Kitasatospora sp. NPDC090308]|uniref:KTSC domain-containing protein n=1 Tax=Kitasatospora sp. NPDC090308 TaxID=3364082 RepID=UPI0038025DA5
MLHQPVQSTNVLSVGYDDRSSTLQIAFRSGSLYEYTRVPAQVHTALLAAASKGGFVARYIKGRYPTRKLAG